MTEQVVAAVLADARRRRRLRRLSLAGAGLAAGVALAVWFTRPPVVPAPSLPAPEVVERQPPSAPDLRHEFTEAGEAFAALTRRTAGDVVGAGRQLVPAVPPPPWPPDLEPAARPFEDAGAALADGFEPVATSARRAVNLVWREFAPGESRRPMRDDR